MVNSNHQSCRVHECGAGRHEEEDGGFWGSVKALEVNMFIQFANLQSLWDRKPMANVRARLYEIRQLFGLRFKLDEMENDVALHNF